MAWVDRLRGKVVALDTAPLIYFIEGHPAYFPLMRPFFEEVDRGSFRVVTSTITLLEVLVQPLRRGDLQLAQLYRSILLNAAGLQILPITSAIADLAAQLRAERQIGAADALQVAAAVDFGATAFLTNDLRIKVGSHIEVINLNDLLHSPSPEKP